MNALTGLHTRPLAELLFEDPLWQRDRAIQYLRLTDQIPGRSCYWHHQQLAAGLIVQSSFTESDCSDRRLTEHSLTLYE